MQAHRECKCVKNSKLVFFLEAAGADTGLRVDREEDRAEDSNGDKVRGARDQTLKEDLIGRFLVDEDIEDRSQQTPADDVRDDLIKVEGQDFFLGKTVPSPRKKS